jgi:hypothetical protein
MQSVSATSRQVYLRSAAPIHRVGGNIVAKVQPAFCRGHAAQPLSACSPAGRQVTPDVAAKAAASSASEGFKWGADMKNLGISVALGLIVWFCPTPSGITPQAWHLLAIFVSTIVGIITQPLPLGAVAMLGLGAAMVTKTLTFAQAFSAFASEIPYDFLNSWFVNMFLPASARCVAIHAVFTSLACCSS